MLQAIIGTAPVNWNNQDVPDFRPVTPREQMLAEMTRAGYSATELDDTFPVDPDETRRELSAHNLSPASTFVAVNLRDPARQATEIDRADERARYVAALGLHHLIIADSGDERRRALAGHVTPSDTLDDEGWQHLTSGLEALAERCGRHNVGIVFHNHVGTYVETEAELRRLLDDTNSEHVALCYDVGHMLYGGGDVMRVMQDYGDRVQYVHLKDVDLAVLERCRQEQLSFADALRLGIFTEFGCGGMNFDAFFAALDTRDYAGWIVVEQDTSKRSPFESARINRAYLRDRFGL